MVAINCKNWQDDWYDDRIVKTKKHLALITFIFMK